MDALDKIIHRVDTTSRGSGLENIHDILFKLLKVFTLRTSSVVLMNARDMPDFVWPILKSRVLKLIYFHQLTDQDPSKRWRRGTLKPKAVPTIF